ncbi:MAG: TlpA disulfide reductase family protein [Clostridia bacterium]|nr:TlpA disulfide reductase family protein [Clostridia bacterium]
MNKKVIYFILAVATVFTLGIFWGLQSRGNQGEAVPETREEVKPAADRLEAARPQVGYPAPDFTLTDLGGKTVSLSDLRGEPVYLNFWATWCPPCREEMPDIQQVYTEKGQQVRFLAVNLTGTEKSVQGVREFLSAGGYTFPVLLDEDNAVAEQYQVRAIPTSIFIDAAGVITYRYAGAMNKEKLEAALEKLKP